MASTAARLAANAATPNTVVQPAHAASGSATAGATAFMINMLAPESPSAWFKSLARRHLGNQRTDRRHDERVRHPLKDAERVEERSRVAAPRRNPPPTSAISSAPAPSRRGAESDRPPSRRAASPARSRPRRSRRRSRSPTVPRAAPAPGTSATDRSVENAKPQTLAAASTRPRSAVNQCADAGRRVDHSAVARTLARAAPPSAGSPRVASWYSYASFVSGCRRVRRRVVRQKRKTPPTGHGGRGCEAVRCYQ